MAIACMCPGWDNTQGVDLVSCIIRIIYLLLYNTQRIIAAKRMQGGSVGGVLEEIMGMGLGWGPSRVRR